MTQPPDNSLDRTSDNLNDALGTLIAELVRADTKASTVLALASVGIGFLATTTRHDQWSSAMVIGTIGTGCLAVATIVLLLAVLPTHINTVSSEGWSRWATMEPDALRTYMRTDRRAEKVVFLSRLVDLKFRRLRLGTSFFLAGAILLFLALALSLVS
ncbi:Pycsar system effector family protein [Streptomyces graminifolii]|uniref:Pycsar system effector family protein n=1 Tax=Streptomyces graminifolii TaxID=1266771 RepID=UPI004059738B